MKIIHYTVDGIFYTGHPRYALKCERALKNAHRFMKNGRKYIKWILAYRKYRAMADKHPHMAKVC